MMKKFLILLLATVIGNGLIAQISFKPVPEQAAQPSNVEPAQLDLRLPEYTAGLPSATPNWLGSQRSFLHQFSPLHLSATPGVRVSADAENGQVYALRGRPSELPAAPADKTDAYAYFSAVATDLGIDNPYEELLFDEPIVDALGHTHIRVRQVFAGIPVEPADAWLHATSDRGFDFYTGRLFPTPDLANLQPGVSGLTALRTAKNQYEDEWVDVPPHQQMLLGGPQSVVTLVVCYVDAVPHLAQRVDLRPNLTEYSTTYLDAQTGAILKHYSNLCGYYNNPGHDHGHDHAEETPHHRELAEKAAQLPPDGPYTTNVLDLSGQVVTLNTYVQNDVYFLADASREMFDGSGGELNGIVLTLDGQGGSPQLESFDPVVGSSLNNTDWSQTAASVHANAGIAYEYFRQNHIRNSIDGEGGDILSLYNVNEPDGQEMDNAFWNGRALFYGNGNQAFDRLPRALDVAGHEMAHGVIQATADLIYEEQPGAINESFADVFGYLVEGESGNYRIGEDVVNTAVFPSGTMRNMQSPNNGAAGPQDFRWQPAHMDEYQNLPVNAQNDNGGVHINSGIPNRAFYLFASNAAVGDDRAAQVYYRALSVYLSRSSRFADLRIAVVQAATDLYGANVVAAANAAFDAVGIGGDGGDYTVDLENNGGERFLLLANTAQSALFLADETGGLIANPLAEVSIISKPSVTDNGRFAVFVDGQNRLRVYDFQTSQLDFVEGDPQTIWRNAAISKDGTKLAALTTDNDNRVLIFDFDSGNGLFYTLFNPTTAEGISTGDVQFADALEWEASGEFLMYDALSILDSGIEFWDIGFLAAWDNNANDFGDGRIIKLANSLPDGISIGNPTFSKNSPYIIAFEEADLNIGLYNLIGANIEFGETDTIFSNSVLNYPNYGVGDDRLVFDAVTNDGTDVLAVVPLADNKISPAGNAQVLVTGGHWGVFFANGERELDTSVEGPVIEDENLLVYPTLFSEQLTVEHREVALAETPVTLYDIIGRPVFQTQLTGSGPQSFTMGNLPAGSYFLAITLAEGTVIHRVVKQ